MRILIVEDDQEKARDIELFLVENYPDAEREVARSFKGGLRAALTGAFDLLLLDMTMRNFDRTIQDDGGRPHHFAGREILRQMKREGVSIPAIVVTTFDRFGEESEEVTLSELMLELKGKFPDYIGTVHYRANVNEWKNTLKDMVDGLAGSHSA